MGEMLIEHAHIRRRPRLRSERGEGAGRDDIARAIGTPNSEA